MEKKELKYRGVKAMPFIIGNEAFEKLGTIGTSTNLLVYLTTIFNMKSVAATNVLNVFNGTCNFGTLVGAFLSDTYLGRYATLGIASVSSLLGMVILAMTAAIPALHPHSSSPASPGQLTFLFAGFTLLVIGASGIRPCNLAFGADQFDPNTQSGKRGINSFFNWYYFTFTFAVMVSLTVIIYVQSDVNWAVGLAIPASLMLLSCVFFFAGTKIYAMVSPEGSPLKSAVQTFAVAFKKRRLTLPPESRLFNHIPQNSINSKLSYTDHLRFLNKAAIKTPEDKIGDDGSALDPWNLRTLQQVEEIKCVIRTIPVWFSGIIYYIVLGQMNTYLVFQAIQSDRRLASTAFKIPAASYGVFAMISLTIWIPVYDRVLVPFLRRITGREGGITLLQRIGVGLVLAIFTMLLSAAVETHRRTVALTRPTVGLAPHSGAISSMSGNLLIPQLILAGISEAFAVIGEIEFFYKQFPENMRSFAGSFLFCGFGLSNYLSSLLISVVNGRSNWLAQDLNHGRLDYFYYLVAALQVLNFALFLLIAKRFVYKRRNDDPSAVSLVNNTV